MKNILLYFWSLVFGISTAASNIRILLTNNGPAIRGSNVTFTATVLDHSDDELKFKFTNYLEEKPFCESVQTSDICNCTVLYSRDYNAGEYRVIVEVETTRWWGRRRGEALTTFNLTEKFNGDLVIKQYNAQRPNKYVAINETVTHVIVLPENELEFIKNNASSMIVYWFIDCVYVGSTTGFSYDHTYTDLLSNHHIDAFIIADNEPLIPTTTTTTTTTPSTTTTSTTTTMKIPTTTGNTSVLPLRNSSPVDINHSVVKRAVTLSYSKKNNDCDPQTDFICDNTSRIMTDTCHSHGTYRQYISVKAPVANVNITGLNWLQHAELMNLQVKYSGTPPFYCCAMYKTGQYNITGNETCSTKNPTDSMVFSLVHYFPDQNPQHTVVVIVENDVFKNVSKATINIYKATITAQLSVIVVPVVFCLIAVILVVFGVAYYQHRSRYTVEVADFDFGQQSHLDYKTFTERLRDSFRNAFRFGEQDETDRDHLVSNTRYNSMT